MTDNEIIKALECCSSEFINACDSCPFKERCDNEECLELYTIDLINRQKADLLRLQNKVGMLEIEKQAIKEDSDKSKVFAMGVIKRQDEKIARLRENNEAIMQTIADVREACEKAHDEAVKDFSHFLIDKAKDGSIDICDLPDLVVEWSSPSRRHTELMKEVGEAFQQGVKGVMQSEMCGGE